MKDYITAVNDPRANPGDRLAALREAVTENPPKTPKTGEINNHIHTIYSFSPYTPAMAALAAREAGLEAAGSVDHDSIAAAEEMIAACGILGIGGCAGFEVRVSFRDVAGSPGPFADRKINNPDSEGIVYMTVQGVPAPKIPLVRDFLTPVREERLRRTRKMAEGAGVILAEGGLEGIDFEEDIVNKSQYAGGGEITERHLLRAAADKLVKKYGKGPALVEGLARVFGVRPPAKIAAYLSDPGNPHYSFDLLGILKSAFLSRIFIQPGEKECIPAKEVVDFARSVGAVPAYAYLGDVGESPTGDKKAEKFEDDFIEELFDALARTGFQAVTYMPPRNTAEQLRRVRRLCGERGFMEISGVDINSSRQSFNCPEVLREEFRHLIDTTWALIAHERLASADGRFGLFSPENPLAGKSLAERLAAYAAAGRDLDLKHPEDSGIEVSTRLLQGRYLS
ncbi:MAG: PHP domain-containing protein [Treponema sp.]|jgi:hypothetical protein|nr:PHP domain-containing protein [Treponema sp.]